MLLCCLLYNHEPSCKLNHPSFLCCSHRAEVKWKHRTALDKTWITKSIFSIISFSIYQFKERNFPRKVKDEGPPSVYSPKCASYTIAFNHVSVFASTAQTRAQIDQSTVCHKHPIKHGDKHSGTRHVEVYLFSST